MADRIISKLENQTGGKAPFRVVAFWQGTIDRERGIYQGAVCDNCSTFIKFVYVVKDANGDNFTLGSTCVERVGGSRLWRESQKAKDVYCFHRHYKKSYLMDEKEKEEKRQEFIKEQELRLVEEEKARQEELKLKAISQYVGKVGERQEFTATVTDTFSGEGAYGRWSCTKLIDDNKNVLSYFNNIRLGDGYASVGDTITFKATVKKHEEYKDEKQTSLSRAGKSVLVDTA